MKILLHCLFFLSASLCLSQSNFTFTFDGDYHYFLNNEDVTSEVSATIILEDIVVEHNALVYEIKGFKNCTDTSNKCEASQVGDRSTIKENGWPIDFYLKKGDYVLTYINDGFYEPNQYHESADTNLFGEINGYYYRYNDYKNTPDGELNDIVFFDDGIWWQDENNDIYALRNGASFGGNVTDSFNHGYVGYDESTNEYLWFKFYTDELTANTINIMEVVPELCAITDVPFYKGKKFSENYTEIELEDNKTMYFFNPDTNQAYIGDMGSNSYLTSARAIELKELPVKDSATGNYWMIDEEGLTYLQLDGEMFNQNIEKVNGQHQSFYDYYDHYWVFPDYEDARPFVLYPAVIAN